MILLHSIQNRERQRPDASTQPHASFSSVESLLRSLPLAVLYSSPFPVFLDNLSNASVSVSF